MKYAKDMESFLQRGLNFCVTPDKVNITEIMAELRKFNHKMKWHEFWFDEENDPHY